MNGSADALPTCRNNADKMRGKEVGYTPCTNLTGRMADIGEIQENLGPATGPGKPIV